MISADSFSLSSESSRHWRPDQRFGRNAQPGVQAARHGQAQRPLADNMANTQALKLINISRRYKHIKLVPRMPNFAAWIGAVDLTQPLSAPVQAEFAQSAV
jgi:hypothetical protein